MVLPLVVTKNIVIIPLCEGDTGDFAELALKEERRVILSFFSRSGVLSDARERVSWMNYCLSVGLNGRNGKEKLSVEPNFCYVCEHSTCQSYIRGGYNIKSKYSFPLGRFLKKIVYQKQIFMP